MGKKILLPLLLAFVLVLTAGCGGMKEQGEIPAAPEKRAEEIRPAAVEQTVLEAAQVESTARMPTDKEILDDYDRAVRVYGWFDLKPLPDSGETVTEDGAEYRRVNEAGLETMEELRVNLRSVFTQGLTEQLLSGEQSRIRYREIDGALYVTGQGRDQLSGKGGVSVEVEPSGDTAYSVNVTVDLVGEDEDVVTGMECWAFPYVLEDGRWGFSEFRLVY